MGFKEFKNDFQEAKKTHEITLEEDTITLVLNGIEISLCFCDSSSYPKSDVIIYSDEDLNLCCNRKSISECILLLEAFLDGHHSELSVQEDSQTDQESDQDYDMDVQEHFIMTTALLKELKSQHLSLRKNDAHTFHFSTARGYMTAISFQVGRLIQTSKISQLFIDTFAVDIKTWIVLCISGDQIRLRICTEPLENSQDLVDVFQKASLITFNNLQNKMTRFGLSYVYENFIKTEEPGKSLTDHVHLLMNFLASPARRCYNCAKVHEMVLDTLKPYCCSDKMCQYSETVGIDQIFLLDQFTRNPELSDFLISITYSAAASKNAYNLTPLPLGVGYFADGDWIGFSSLDDPIAIATKVIGIAY